MAELRVGPAGGLGGESAGELRIPAGARLAQIHVLYGQYVHAVQLIYRAGAGAPVPLPALGALGGERGVFTLEPGERVVAVSGLADWYIDQLQIHTDRRSSPAYGGAGTQRSFRLELPPGAELAGVFGRSGWYLDALGLIARPARGA